MNLLDDGIDRHLRMKSASEKDACPAVFYLVSNLAETGCVRLRFCRVGIDQMMHPRFSGKIAVYSPFQLTVGLSLPLMLTQVFCPRVHQEYLQITIGDFSVSEDSPPICAVTTPHPTIFMHCTRKFCCPFWNDVVFNGNQYGSLLNLSPNVSDDDGHAPVVPGAQIRSRIGKFRKKGNCC